MPEIQLLDDDGRPAALRFVVTSEAARYLITANDLEPGQDVQVTVAAEPSGTSALKEGKPDGNPTENR